MQREALRQRIHYLIEHGGTYPEEDCPRRPRDRLILGILIVMMVLEIANLLL